MSEHIIISHSERVTTLTIARPEKKNALTQDMYAAMAQALATYAADDETRAFIITGTGDMFTAGNDLQGFSTGNDTDEVPPVIDFLNGIRDCPKPLIAAVNGRAIGVGLTMLLHCDLVYAAASATFGAPFAKLGVVPEAGSSLLLPAAVGMAVANDILLAGRTLSAAEALSHGLVARVFPDAEFEAAVAEIARGIAGSAPTALKHAKSLIRNQRARITEQMAVEMKLFAEQLQSPEFTESITAMLEKRAPVYS